MIEPNCVHRKWNTYLMRPRQRRNISSPINKMYYKHPHENWFQKGLRYADQGLRVYGTAKGIYEVGSAIASGVRMAAPMMALL